MKNKKKKRKTLRCFYMTGRIMGIFFIALGVLCLFGISGEESIFGKSVLMSSAILLGMWGGFMVFDLK